MEQTNSSRSDCHSRGRFVYPSVKGRDLDEDCPRSVDGYFVISYFHANHVDSYTITALTNKPYPKDRLSCQSGRVGHFSPNDLHDNFLLVTGNEAVLSNSLLALVLRPFLQYAPG